MANGVLLPLLRLMVGRKSCGTVLLTRLDFGVDMLRLNVSRSNDSLKPVRAASEGLEHHTSYLDQPRCLRL
jgi:hypothetical protein